MEKKIIVLGGNKLHKGFLDVKEKLQLDQVIVIDWNKEPPYKGDCFIQCDIKDYDAIEKMDIDWENIRFVYTSADIAVRTQVRLHEKMQLLGPSYEAINNTLIKGNSTECWRKSGILNKYSQVLEKVEELEQNSTKKLIVKPNCSSGSRNITILEAKDWNKANLEAAIHSAKEESMDHRAIVEEFCEGTEYTVDMLGDNEGNVSVYGISKKYHTPYNTRNKVAVKLHYNPMDVSMEELERIADFGIACYKSVGLKNSFGHLEVIVMHDGRIVPVEIGARSSGYIATHLLDLINKTSLLKTFGGVIRGEKVDNGIVFERDRSSMYYFYDLPPGISKKKTDLGAFLDKKICSVMHDRENLIEGKKIDMLNADHERIGVEILAGRRQDLTIENVCRAEQLFNEAFMGGTE